MRLQRCSRCHGDQGDRRCAQCGGELPPGRRRWCAAACALEWEANHVWRVARARALELQPRCEICGDAELLEVHHDPPVGEHGYGHGCQHHQDKLHVLCAAHHTEADKARRHAEKGEPMQLSLIAA